MVHDEFKSLVSLEGASYDGRRHVGSDDREPIIDARLRSREFVESPHSGHKSTLTGNNEHPVEGRGAEATMRTDRKEVEELQNLRNGEPQMDHAEGGVDAKIEEGKFRGELEQNVEVIKVIEVVVTEKGGDAGAGYVDENQSAQNRPRIALPLQVPRRRRRGCPAKLITTEMEVGTSDHVRKSGENKTCFEERILIEQTELGKRPIVNLRSKVAHNSANKVKNEEDGESNASVG